MQSAKRFASLLIQSHQELRSLITLYISCASFCSCSFFSLRSWVSLRSWIFVKYPFCTYTANSGRSMLLISPPPPVGDADYRLQSFLFHSASRRRWLDRCVFLRSLDTQDMRQFHLLRSCVYLDSQFALLALNLTGHGTVLVVERANFTATAMRAFVAPKLLVVFNLVHKLPQFCILGFETLSYRLFFDCPLDECSDVKIFFVNLQRIVRHLYVLPWLICCAHVSLLSPHAQKPSGLTMSVFHLWHHQPLR